MKLNRAGKAPPFGSTVFGSLNSSKNGSNSDPNGVGLAVGSYCRSVATKSMESRGVLCLKTLSHGRGLIYGNLYSLYSGFMACI